MTEYEEITAGKSVQELIKEREYQIQVLGYNKGDSFPSYLTWLINKKMNTVQEVLDACRIDGNNVYLPNVQLDRSLYVQVDKKLKGIGGKWNRKAKAHVFEEDPSELLGRVKSGEEINLKKDFQFFETPKDLADELVQLAFEIPYNVGAVLEPSAGKGRIIDAIHKYDQDIVVKCCELMSSNITYLEEKYGNRIQFEGTNFLEHKKPNYYSTIIANPPFTKGQDIQHFYHMYESLEPGGIVVCVMSSSWLHNSTKRYKDFRKFLGFDDEKEESWKDRIMRKEAAKGSADCHMMRENDEGNFEEVYIKSYPAGTFKESGTNVITVVVRLRKSDD